jgi:homoserine dehydrogenase
LSNSPLKIGIAGLGTVGVGVVKLLSQQADLISLRSGRDIVITTVSARVPSKDRGVDLGGVNWSYDPIELATKR